MGTLGRSLGRRPRGVALIMLLALITLATLFVLVNRLSQPNVQDDRHRITQAALAQAKQALIGYAMAYPEQHRRGSPERAAFVPGHLPCPDTNSALGNEGNEDPTCGAKGVTVIGYLPWKTLGLPPLRDDWGNCLWYAVSGSFKRNPKMDLLNWDSLGQFQVVGPDGSTVITGATPESRPVAVIFSPGPPLPGQNRTGGTGQCGGDFDPAHFLDTVRAVNNAVPNSAAEGITTVAATGPANSFNDRLLWIMRDDILARGIEKRSDLNTSLQGLLPRVAECIATYGKKNSSGLLPWAAKIDLADHTPDTYQNDRFIDTTDLLVGRIPFQVRKSFQVTGSTLPSFTSGACSGSGDPDCRLFRADNCSSLLSIAGYPTPLDDTNWKDSPDGWFDKWKDHLFYAVAEDFKPSSTPVGGPCDNPTVAGRKCLYVDNVGPYASVIIFAGRRQAGQVRATLADRNSPSNYLEEPNASAISINDTSNPQFGKFAHAGNDLIVCIKKDLKIDPSCSNP